jgi:hypothetical protein
MSLVNYVAAQRLCGTYQNGDITKRLNEVYTNEVSTLEPGLVAIQIASIGEEKW